MGEFNLKSGNATPFKMMGSSKTHEKPTKQKPTKQKRVDPNINPKTGLYYPKPGGAEGNKPPTPKPPPPNPEKGKKVHDPNKPPRKVIPEGE